MPMDKLFADHEESFIDSVLGGAISISRSIYLHDDRLLELVPDGEKWVAVLTDHSPPDFDPKERDFVIEPTNTRNWAGAHQYDWKEDG